MITKQIHKALLAAAVGLLAMGSLQAQTRMEKAVVATGGGRTSGSTMTMDYTLGQPVTGRAESATMTGQFGFWSIATAALSVDPSTGAGAVTAMSVTPNPVSSRSTLDVTLASGGPVEVNLYDMSGRLVRSLYDGTRPAGHFSVPIEAAGLASGTYFVAVSLPGSLLQRMVTVVR